MNIKVDDLRHPKVKELLQKHLDDMYATSPKESVHALDLSGLREANVRFWSAWQGDELLGCGALKILNSKHGEIKSMRTSESHNRKGVATNILQHIIEHGQQIGLKQLSLETGTQDFFKPARQLYLKNGFQDCGPFADYSLDPNSLFMTLFITKGEFRTRD
ncbi:GNAT family N-acetyltransferase [Paraglaciecola sp. 2405UD69-4]|uniref:GNAT family N-acetyltransferase n=1 Tax=Paraglaciecola sp. 2405UD69-4 TaxID=3391836 RepID=UPI0039C9594D